MAWDSMEACRLRGGAMGAGRAPTALLYGAKEKTWVAGLRRP